MAKYKVLSTKKLELSLVEQAREYDIEIIEQEAIKVYPILSKEKWQEIFGIIEAKKENIVFTSSNAVVAVRKYLNDYINPFDINWKIFSLSGKTKEAIESGSLGTIVETGRYAKELAEKIIANQIDEVVFFCGDKRREVLPKILKEAEVAIHEIVVYETILTPVVLKDTVDAVLFFSPSAVQSFFSVNQLKNDVVCFAVGQTTAGSIHEFSQNKIITSESPAQEKVLASVRQYFQNIKQML